MTEDEAADNLYGQLFGPTSRRFDEMKSSSRLIAHYTTADTAVKIISGASLWLRNAAVMNDFMEIRFGRKCMATALETKWSEISALFSSNHVGLHEDVVRWLAAVNETVSTQTYLTSFAEHDLNDDLGKLSMWRAYGGPVAGVAIIFNTDVFESDSAGEKLSTFPLPVRYGELEFQDHFDETLSCLNANQSLLNDVPRDRAKSILFHVLQNMILSTKHVGFREEQEWRIVHSPYLFPSSFVQEQIVTLGGLPQAIYKLPLRNMPGLDVPELDLAKLVIKIIIGPTKYPSQVAAALRSVMLANGIDRIDDRIVISDIPLRQSG